MSVNKCFSQSEARATILDDGLIGTKTTNLVEDIDDSNED